MESHEGRKKRKRTSSSSSSSSDLASFSSTNGVGSELFWEDDSLPYFYREEIQETFAWGVKPYVGEQWTREQDQILANYFFDTKKRQKKKGQLDRKDGKELVSLIERKTSSQYSCFECCLRAIQLDLIHGEEATQLCYDFMGKVNCHGLAVEKGCVYYKKHSQGSASLSSMKTFTQPLNQTTKSQKVREYREKLSDLSSFVISSTIIPAIISESENKGSEEESESENEVDGKSEQEDQRSIILQKKKWENLDWEQEEDNIISYETNPAESFLELNYPQFQWSSRPGQD